MSNGFSSLLFHFPLDGVRQIPPNSNLIIDRVSGEYIGGLAGAIQVVKDYDMGFGLCTGFDGQTNYIEVPAPTDRMSDFREKDATMMGWVFIDNLGGTQTILADLGKRFFLGIMNGALRFVVNPSQVFGVNGAVEAGKWHHVAATIDRAGKTVSLYVDGKLAESITDDAKTPVKIGGANLQVGNSTVRSAAGFFQGKMAHFRLYSSALNQNQIAGAMLDDVTAATGFKRTHPLEFSLRNVVDQPALFFSDDPAGQTVSIDVKNTSDRAIQFLNDADWHLKLEFRKGVLLEDNSFESSWTKVGQVEVGAETIAYKFLAPPDTTIAAGQSTNFQLTAIKASPSGGTRSTLAKMTYQMIQAVGAEGAPLNDARLMHLDIVNKQGRQFMPVHVGIVGNSRVLNDGVSENKIILRLTNLSNEPLIFQKGVPTSKFYLSFDVQADDENKDWALVKSSELQGINVRIIDQEAGQTFTEHFKAHTNSQEQNWEILTIQETTLHYDEYFEIEISQLKTSMGPGTSKIYFRYQDVPGFQNGQFITPVEKSPIVISDNNHVGIGVQDPSSKLTILGDLMFKKEQSNSWAGITQENVGGGATLEFTTSDKSGDQATRLLFRGGSDGSNVEFYNGASGVEKQTMLINSSGNVGIGTPAPQAKLHVDGDVKVDGRVIGDGFPSPISTHVFKPDNVGKKIKITDLDLDADRMYMMILKLENPQGINVDYKFHVNGDNKHAHYFTVSTQELDERYYGHSAQNPFFANAGKSAHHFFIAHMVRSTSGSVVIHGHGGFETNGPSPSGYQLWKFFLTYNGKKNVNVNSLIVQAGSDPGAGKFGLNSEVLVYKWGW